MILCVPGWDLARIPLLLAATSHNFTLYLVNLSWFPGFQINYSCVLVSRLKLSRERLGYASQVVEQNLHVAQRRAIVQNAAAQGEPAIEHGVR